MRRVRVLAIFASIVGLAALAPPAAAINLPPGFETETLVASTPSAVGAEFAPDGRLFYNEGGVLHVRNPDGATSDLPGVPGFAFGLALDKDFATNGYLYMAYMQANLEHARIDRLTISPANQQLGSTTILGKVNGPCPQGPPVNTSDCIPIKDPAVHSLGTLISDPRDGTLWVGNGDNALPGSDDPHARDAQDVNGMSGKVLHVDREGNGLPGHPFCPADDDLTHNCTKVYARGLRNPYRFRLRPSDFVPIAGDVGLESREEVDVIRPGATTAGPATRATSAPRARTRSIRSARPCTPIPPRRATRRRSTPTTTPPDSRSQAGRYTRPRADLPTSPPSTAATTSSPTT